MTVDDAIAPALAQLDHAMASMGPVRPRREDPTITACRRALVAARRLEGCDREPAVRLTKRELIDGSVWIRVHVDYSTRPVVGPARYGYSPSTGTLELWCKAEVEDGGV